MPTQHVSTVSTERLEAIMEAAAKAAEAIRSLESAVSQIDDMGAYCTRWEALAERLEKDCREIRTEVMFKRAQALIK